MKRTKILPSVITWAFAAIFSYPLILVPLSVFKTKQELYQNPLGLPTSLSPVNLVAAFESMKYLRSLFNTALITSLSVGIGILITAMAGYAIARRPGHLSQATYMFFLAGLIIPFQMIMIPLYKVMLGFKLMSTYQGMILLYVGQMTPFATFLIVGFMKTVPRELEEAACIDGCSSFATFFKIVFPLLMPIVSTIAILQIIGIWNDFMAPLLYLQKSDMQTLVVRLNGFMGEYFNDWSRIFSAILLIALPAVILYLFLRRYVMEGIVQGAIK